MKRSLIAVTFAAVLCAVAALVSSPAQAGRAKATPTPSPTPVPLPTATPEPPQIAIPKLIAALRKNPNDRDSMAQLAIEYLGINHPELALPLTQHLLQQGDKTAQVYYYDGIAQLQLGNAAAATSDLESASDREPTNIGILSQLTNLYLKTNRLSDALRVANRAVTFHKDDPSAYVNLGVVYANQQKYDEARKTFEKAYALNPKDISPLLQEAQTYQVQNAIPSALRVVQRALAVDPTNAQALVYRAQLYAGEKEFDQSASAYDDAVAAATSDDQKVGILIQKALMYAGAKQSSQAEGVFTSTIARFPKISAAHTAYGEYWIQMHQLPRAQQEFLAALRVNPDDPTALLDMAQLKMSGGHTVDAIGYLKKLTSAAPSAQAYALLGQAYIANRDFSGAKDACGKAFQIERTPDTLGCIAGSDYNLKNYKEAAQIFDVLDKNVQKFVNANPQYLYMMGVSYERTNQKSKALDAYRRLLKQMRPGTKEYKKLQAQIRDLSKPARETAKKKS